MTLAPAAALACGNAVRLRTTEANQLVAKVERLLDEGAYRKVLRVATENEEHEIADAGLERRYQTAVAVARTRGGQLARGLQDLTWLSERAPDDPYLKTRRAEALAKTARGKDEAAVILATLEEKDLISDAEGWLTLAELRRGDGAAVTRALERCRAMAKDPKMCAVKASKPAKKVKPVDGQS